MSRGIKFEFDADTIRMERGLQRAENALEDMQREAVQTDVALRSIPNEVNVGVDFDRGSALVQAQLLGQQLENAVGEVDVGVDLDAGGAVAQAAAVGRQLEAAVGDVNVGVDAEAGAFAALRARFIAQKAALEASISDIEVDIDPSKALRDLQRIERQLDRLDRLGNEQRLSVGIDPEEIENIEAASTNIYGLVAAGPLSTVD